MQAPFPFQAAARLVDFMRQADQADLINLAAGVPGHDSLPVEALRQAFEEAYETDGAALYGYHHPEGDHPLRDLLATRQIARGVPSLSGSEIVITTGCTQALQLMLSILVKPGDVVAFEAPAYYGMLELVATMGAKALPIPVKDIGGIDLDLAEEALQRWKPVCFVVCPSLSNPSGASLSQPDRERLVSICKSAGVRLLEDDIYGELLDEGAPKPCFAYDDGSTVSYVASFSKSVAPALRIGYCIAGTPELHDAVAAKKCQQDLHGSVISEVTFRQYLKRGSMEPHLHWLRERNRRRRQIVLDAIAAYFPTDCQVEAPAGGFMLWAELPEGTDLPALREAARQEKVAFAPGTVFFARPANATPDRKAFARLNCAKANETDLVKGIETLGRLLKARR